MLTIEIRGIEAVCSKINFTPAKKERVRKALIDSGFLIEGRAKRRCPVDTGRLRASISTAWDGSGRPTLNNPVKESTDDDAVLPPQREHDDIAVVRVGTNVKYAPYIEGGWSKQAPSGFLTPAVLESKKDVVSLLSKAME